eukprot:gene17002-9263_t
MGDGRRATGAARERQRPARCVWAMKHSDPVLSFSVADIGGCFDVSGVC